MINCNVYKGQGVLSTEPTEECRCHNRFDHLKVFFFMSMVFQEVSTLEIKLKFNQFRPMNIKTFHAILHAQIELLLGPQRYANNNTKTNDFYYL